MEDGTSGMNERTGWTEGTEETRPGSRAPDQPRAEDLERGRQRALKIFRYGGMAYFLLLGLIALMLHLQGVLWIALQQFAAGVFLLVLLSLPPVILGGVLLLLLRLGRRDGGAGGGPGGAGG